MTSFKIAQNPTFSVTVDIPRIGGDPNKVPFEFKYRSRTELAALFVGWAERVKQDQAGFDEKGPDMTLADYTSADIERQIVQVQDLVVGWGFADAFNAESIRALVETSVGAAKAIVDAYQGAFNQARLGN
jgi:hypothetical protein